MNETNLMKSAGFDLSIEAAKTALIYFVFIAVMSLITLIFFAKDKKNSSKEGRGRIPEITLLSLTTFGGALGAFIGMYVLRHKTNPVTKFHFTVTAWLSLLVQVALGVLLLHHP